MIGLIAPPVEIGAQSGVDQIEQIAQDAVLVDVGHLIQGGDELQPDRRHGFFFALKRIAPARVRLEAALEIAVQKPRDSGIAE